MIKTLLSLLTAAILVHTSALADDYSIDFEQPASSERFEKTDWFAYGPADITFINGAERASIDPTVARSGRQSLRIFYPESAVGPSQGGHQAAIMVTPEEEYYLSYWIKFDQDFSWGNTRHGGKLPGLAQGKHCSGGDVCDGTNGFTARYMWRRDGAAVLYLYHMDKPGKWGEDFPLLSKDGKPLFFSPGAWTHLVQRVKINSGENSDGEVQVWVNGSEALNLNGLRFVSDGSKIDRFYVSTFHGGSEPGWGPMNDSIAWIDDIEISSNPLPVKTPRNQLILGKGTNLAHWLSQTKRSGEQRRRFILENDIADIAQLGFDHIRLPIDEEQMWDEDGNRDAVAFEIMHDAIRWGLKYDLRVLVDLHILRSHHFNAVDKPLWTETSAQDQFIALWEDLSLALHEYPADRVAYELMNEPVADDPGDWNKLLARAFTAVRALEPDRTVVVGSNRWQSANTFDELVVPRDDNIILSFHFYEPFMLSHYGTRWTFMKAYKGPVHYPGVILTQSEFDEIPENQKAAVREFVGRTFNKQILTEMMEKPLRVAEELDLPLYCGEYGVFNMAPTVDRLRWYEDIQSIFDEHNISSANWNYKSDQFGFVGNDGRTFEDIKGVLVKH